MKSRFEPSHHVMVGVVHYSLLCANDCYFVV